LNILLLLVVVDRAVKETIGTRAGALAGIKLLLVLQFPLAAQLL
jgi:hypothetical protein